MEKIKIRMRLEPFLGRCSPAATAGLSAALGDDKKEVLMQEVPARVGAGTFGACYKALGGAPEAL
jgi:hypothetical protein